jgi:hypothetical protein
MALCGYTSITEWVATMRSYPFYAIVSGFRPYDVPGVGTFYDFMNLVMSRVPKGRKRKTDEKDKPKHSGIIKRLAHRLLSGRKLPFRFSDASIIKEIFDAVFVAHSQELGLIDENALIISGDGSKLPTWASPYGKKICECQGKCDCVRKLLDKEAEWGWDSSMGVWIRLL